MIHFNKLPKREVGAGMPSGHSITVQDNARRAEAEIGSRKLHEAVEELLWRMRSGGAGAPPE